MRQNLMTSHSKVKHNVLQRPNAPPGRQASKFGFCIFLEYNLRLDGGVAVSTLTLQREGSNPNWILSGCNLHGSSHSPMTHFRG